MATQLRTPVAKRYFSRVPGSKYTFANGDSIEFAYGRYDFDPTTDAMQDVFMVQSVNNSVHPFNGRTKAEAYFAELEHLINTNNPLIFEQGKNPDVKLPDELNPAKNAKSEAEILQGNAALLNSGRAVSETGDANTGATGMTDVNQSTVDKDLQATLFKEKVITGPGASRADQIRSEAAARLASQSNSAPSISGT